MNPPRPALLGIIIPAYKTKFLRATLQSLAAQTDQRFQLYVGDDASPEPVETIVHEFSRKISIRYQRFNENLGRKSLVGHWTRCLKLTREPWLWIFADDDFLEPGCVAAFYAALEKTDGQHDAYRFNTVLEKNDAPEERPAHPELQSGRDFLCDQLRGPHNSNMQEVIFSRPAWERTGIPDFPLAWFADDAFIASLGEPLPLRTLAGPRIHWRWSAENITGNSSRAMWRLKFRAAAQFVQWASDFLNAQKMAARAAARLTQQWYFDYLLPQEIFLDAECRRAALELSRRCWGSSTQRVRLKLLAFNAHLFVKKTVRLTRRKLN
jgi:glycosyltransferase involved in cell wall biosynthesis